MRRRRELRPGPDGMAEVVLLRNPIPRALSIVGWGANDRPATSWKNIHGPPELGLPSAEIMAQVECLRATPTPTVITASGASPDALVGFIDETLAAWEAVVVDALDRATTAADRASRAVSATSQAGARVAAIATALGPRASASARAASVMAIEPLQPQTNPTVDSQLERTRVLAAVEYIRAQLMAASVAAMATAAPSELTETVMEPFAQVAELLSGWLGSIPDGVVGVPTVRSGSRHNKADKARLAELRRIIDELDPSSTEKSVMTLEQLSAIASADPVGFLGVIDTALKSANANPKSTVRFAWGDTGVTQDSPEAVLAQLRQFLDGGQLAGLIASAVTAVNPDTAAQGDSPQVASAMKTAGAMRDGFAKFIAAELRKNPTGDLANAVRSIVAPSVALALTESLKAFHEGSSAPSNPAASPDPWAFDDADITPAAAQRSAKPGTVDPCRAELPSISRR